MLSRKSKGTNAERELVHLFWDNGWAAIRVAGSGSVSFPAPDILAGRGERKLIIECKSLRSDNLYLSNSEIQELKDFSSIFISEPWVGVRFDFEKWSFLRLDDLKETKKGNFLVSKLIAKQKGLSFSELIGEYYQKKLNKLDI